MRRRSRLIVFGALVAMWSAVSGTSFGLQDPPQPKDVMHREFPHKAGSLEPVTEPGKSDLDPTCDPDHPHHNHHCDETNQEAVDLGMDCGLPVYSVTAGKVIRIDSGSGTGNFMVIRERDPDEGGNHYITYESLSPTHSVTLDELVVPGERISSVSNTASGFCHLHFQRSDLPPTFTKETDHQHDERVPPIDGQLALADDDVCQVGESPPCDGGGPYYKSSNAGVGYDSGGAKADAIAGFKNQYWEDDSGDEDGDITGELSSAWNGYGRPWAANLLWLPCRYKMTATTHWAYDCTTGAYSGKVQIMLHEAPGLYLRGFMKGTGMVRQVLREQFLFGYTELYQGKDFVHWIGYPIEPLRYFLDPPFLPHWYQRFQNGEIRFWDFGEPPYDCWVEIYIGTPPPIYYGPNQPTAAWKYHECGEPLVYGDFIA